ncbi:hypothetical protein TNCV_80651 [Trichonephila clavipes]|nr:hypothetical protein TNCV_80651 [Trichonephila clavipes]
MTFDEEDCGFQMLYCDEIVTSLQEESDSVDDKMEEEENNNNESMSGFIYCMDHIRLSEQSCMRTVSGAN